MILKSNKHEVEIQIKNFELPDRESDMDYLRIGLRVTSKKENWQAMHHCLTPREALELSKWMRKLASKKHRYGDRIKFSDPSLSFKATILKNGIKKVVIGFSDKCKPAFIKGKRPYFISLELTDKELKQAAFDLKKELPQCKKLFLPDLIQMNEGEIKDLVLINAPDTVRFAAGRRQKDKATPVSAGEKNVIHIMISHSGEFEKCNETNQTFWTPFQMVFLKANANPLLLHGAEFYEKAIKNNFCSILNEHLINHFKAAFFDLDARYKKSLEPGVRSSEKEKNSAKTKVESEVKEKISTENSNIVYKPGRIDESFIQFYEEEFYKEDADKLVGAAYINISYKGTAYNPFCIALSIEPVVEFIKLFNNDFKMALHFLKTHVPQVFLESIKDRKNRCEYEKLNLKFDYKLSETFKTKKTC